jgi:putative endonuclease
MEQKLNKKLKNKETGNKGEKITAHYFKSCGYVVLGMNYLKKWGEIDVIVQKDNKVHFIEVKTVSYGTKYDLELAVLRGTHRPEENVHNFKLKKLARAVETWIAEYKWTGDFQIDVAAVRIVPRETYATIKIISNITID